ncbi:hypothetical protein NUV66_17015 [Pseudomonas sp. 32.2.56]|uniref:hypothetical protein n=1 Tax=Pseudomonas sp. 32.2.56 TaxID=2969303 RepID=UPI0021503996|nr:hypothetical protein [Pseudomonas sp. 32.2.56]MCR4511010.1 hypothetical protein [Pseudomonas sp. 32.2.56]
MATNVIPIAIAVIFLALIFLIFFIFYRKISKSLASLSPALTTLWLFILIFPWLMTWFYVPLINSIYINNPELKTAAWDVGAALAIYLGMCLSYILGIIAGCFATWRLIILSRKQHRASET